MRHSCDWLPARGATEEQAIGLSTATATAATRAAAGSVVGGSPATHRVGPA
jgi:hypothetical protein